MPIVANRYHYLPVPGWGPEQKPLTGRERRPSMPKDAIYIGRGTPLGNPYRRDQYGPMALHRYRDWLFGKIKRRDPDVMAAFRQIGPETLLVCSCKAASGDFVSLRAMPIIVFYDNTACLDMVLDGSEGDIPDQADAGTGAPQDPSITPVWKIRLGSGIDAFAFIPLVHLSKKVADKVRGALAPFTLPPKRIIHPILDRLIPSRTSEVLERLRSCRASNSTGLGESAEISARAIGTQPGLLGSSSPERNALSDELGLPLVDLRVHSLGLKARYNACHGDIALSAWHWLKSIGEI